MRLLLLSSVLFAMTDPSAGQSARPPVRPSAWPDADWAVLEAKVQWAIERRLDTLPPGQAIAQLGKSFVGATYTPGTLEVPGPERVVINLREPRRSGPMPGFWRRCATGAGESTATRAGSTISRNG
jgi:hypothetical protein